MIRNLKSLGLALAAVFALSALAASTASANPAMFTQNVGFGSLAQILVSQIGSDTFNVPGSVLSVKCATAAAKGTPISTIETESTVYDFFNRFGPEATYITLTPEFNTCHAVPFGLTKTATITTNQCYYLLNATKDTSEFHSPFTVTPWSMDLTIRCPAGKQIEIHVYETSSHEHKLAKTLCTYDIPPQQILNQIQLTNEPAVEGIDDVVAHVNATVTTTNTIQSNVCGMGEQVQATYKGTDTIRATNEAFMFVNTTIS